VLESLRALVPDLEVKMVDTQIMNQLSYTVQNERFRSLGFEFRGDHGTALRETIEKLRNIRHAPKA
jgi:hypothetical protein